MTLNLKYFLHLITMAMIWLKMVNSVNKIDNIFNSTHIKGLFFGKVPYVIKKKNSHIKDLKCYPSTRRCIVLAPCVCFIQDM